MHNPNSQARVNRLKRENKHLRNELKIISRTIDHTLDDVETKTISPKQ
jgi:hypothetical protein